MTAIAERLRAESDRRAATDRAARRASSRTSENAPDLPIPLPQLPTHAARPAPSCTPAAHSPAATPSPCSCPSSPTPFPPGARSPVPSASPSSPPPPSSYTATPNLPPLPPNVDPDKLINDTIIPEYSALAVCRLHGLTVAQYLAWLKHPATAQTLADLREISEIRARTLAACSAPQALQQLHRLMRDDPIELEGLTPTTKETMRRSANTILRVAGLHTAPKPPKTERANPTHTPGGTTEPAAGSVVAAPDQPTPTAPPQPRRAPSAGPVDARTTPPTPSPTPSTNPTSHPTPTPTTPKPQSAPVPLAA